MKLHKILEQEKKFREGVEKFNEDIFIAKNIDEINVIMNKILDLTFIYSSKKNNRPNKALTIFTKYLDLNTTREEKVQREIKSKKEKTYMDYLHKFNVLKNQGYSYRKISEYAKKNLNITVSNETIRKKLIEYNENQNEF